MLRLILRQTNWGIFGAVFGFIVGFFIKIFLIEIVGLEAWGKYVTAQIFSSISETFLSIGIPFIILKYIPSFVEDNLDKASRISSIFLKYSFVIGLLYLILIYFFSSSINNIIYNDISHFEMILFLMCIHVPISMLFGVVVSLYRSILKIKEIVIYGTFIAVSIRAIMTFILFQFTSDIIYFILIEVFTQLFVLLVLIFLFNKNEFPLFVGSNISEITKDSKIKEYGKKMYLNSIIAFISGHSLSFIISIKLPSYDVGAYNILLSLTGLTTFLLINLNKVFAPAISKLFHDSKFIELNSLYKQTTLIINLITIPLILVVIIFSDEILKLYNEEMINYKIYLFYMLIGGMISLSSGSSGTIMVMAGLEKENLYLQSIRSILLIILSVLLIPIFGMLSVVLLYVFFMLFINLFQLIFIYKHLNITPFSNNLYVIFTLTICLIYFCITQDYTFKFYHYFLIPILIYFFYFVIMLKPIKKLIKEFVK